MQLELKDLAIGEGKYDTMDVIVGDDGIQINVNPDGTCSRRICLKDDGTLTVYDHWTGKALESMNVLGE